VIIKYKNQTISKINTHKEATLLCDIKRMSPTHLDWYFYHSRHKQKSMQVIVGWCRRWACRNTILILLGSEEELIYTAWQPKS